MAATAMEEEVPDVKPHLGYFFSLDEASKEVQQHEERTGSRYAFLRADPEFGSTTWTKEDCRIQWEEVEVYQGERLEFDGVPFMVLGTKYLGCQHGVRAPARHSKYLEWRKEEGGEALGRKSNCPAKIILKEVVKFTDYKIDHNTSYEKKKWSKVVRDDIRDGLARAQRRIYVQFPSNCDHLHDVADKSVMYHCLVCNAKLSASIRSATNIFKSEVRTSHRQLEVVNLLSDIVGDELNEAITHSQILCSRCFNLIDDIDSLQEQLLTKQQMIVSRYNRTIAEVTHKPQHSHDFIPDDCIEEEISNGRRRGRSRGRGRGRVRKLSGRGRVGQQQSQEEDLQQHEDLCTIKVERDDTTTTTTTNATDNTDATDATDATATTTTVTTTITTLASTNDITCTVGLYQPLSPSPPSPPTLKTIKKEDIMSELYPLQSEQEKLDSLEDAMAVVPMEEEDDRAEVGGDGVDGGEMITMVGGGEEEEGVEEGGEMISMVRGAEGGEVEARVLEVVEEVLESEQKQAAKMLTCSQCNKQFHNKAAIRNHMKVHNSFDDEAHCEMCEKSFSNKYSLKVHLKTHINRDRPHNCRICHKSFFKRYHLNNHLKSHEGEKNFVCELCGKALSTPKTLELHTLTHTGEKPFQCEICGSTFRQRSNLLTHIKATHYQEKNYQCTICTKSFVRKRLLVYHINSVHTGQRPYKCELCNATFVYPHYYKRHLRKHTGDRPHKCNVCGKTFSSRENRNAHMFIHSDKKPYECKLCGAGFMRKPMCVAHLSLHGQSESPEANIIFNSPSLLVSASEAGVVAGDGGEVAQLVTASGTDEVARAVTTVKMVEEGPHHHVQHHHQPHHHHTGIMRDGKIVKVMSRPIQIIETDDTTRYVIHTDDRVREENMDQFFAALQGQVVEVRSEDF